MRIVAKVNCFIITLIMIVSLFSCTNLKSREKNGEIVAMHWNCTFYAWNESSQNKEDKVLGAIFEYMPDFFTTSEGSFAKSDLSYATDYSAYNKLKEKGYEVTGNKFTETSQKVLDGNYNKKIFSEEFIACAKANEYFAKIGETTSTQIIYNSNRFSLVDSGSRLYCFTDRYTGTNSKSFSYGIFTSKNQNDSLYGQTIIVTATHFAVMSDNYKDLTYSWKSSKIYPYKNFENSIGTMWRQQNAQEFIDFLDTLYKEYPDAIFICGGDYNANKDSSIIAILETSSYLTNAYNIAPSNLRDSGRSTHSQGSDSDPTSGNAIDHIFVNKLNTVVTKQLIDRGEYSRDGSDHYPVVVYLRSNK